MRVDFKNAARRHFADAQLLEQSNRLANADHLYGISAECALKAIIVEENPAAVHPISGEFIDKDYWLHFKSTNSKRDLWQVFSVGFAGRLAAHNPLPSSNPFSDWEIDQRYWADNCFSHVNIIQHSQGCRELQQMLDTHFKNGGT